MMRILIFNWRDIKNPEAGGAEIYLHEQAARWVKKGCEVTLFCSAFPGCKKREIIDGINIVRAGNKYSVYFMAFLYYLFKFRNKYDIIIDAENGIPFFTPLYSSKPKVLLIHHVHKDIFFKELPFPLALIGYFLEMKLMPLIYKKVNIITVSKSSKEKILEYRLTKKPVEIVYNGLGKAWIDKKIKKSRKPLVVYLGRFKKYKSIDILIKAFIKVNHLIPESKLLIIGKGDQEKNLKKLIKKNKMEDKIKICNALNMSEEEKINKVGKGWFAVNPSFIEGWGVTIIECNALGLPVIGSNVSGIRDSIKNGKTGLLFEYGNVDELSKKIILLIKNNKKRKELSKNALKWSKKFSWDKSAEKFLEILKRINAKKIQNN